MTRWWVVKFVSPLYSDRPFEVMELVELIVISHNRVDGLENNRVSFPCFIFARFTFLSVCLLRSISRCVSDRGGCVIGTSSGTGAGTLVQLESYQLGHDINQFIQFRFQCVCYRLP
jgi:hypothetical protein